MFNAFHKHDRYIYDVFIIVNDDDLDILWILLQWIVLSNQVGSAFNKQAATATATANVFDAFISLSELSQLFLKHCDDTNSLRVIEIFSFHLWIILQQLRATRLLYRMLRALFATGADKTLLVQQYKTLLVQQSALLSSFFCY
jgi:hypothetical protein